MKSTFNFRPYHFLVSAGLFLSVLVTSCSKDDNPTPAPVTPTVVGVAQSDTSFSILVAAVVKAGLVATLSDLSKSYTVFAPTNNAFRAAGITTSVIDGYSASDVTNVLTPILLYHVIGAEVLSTGVPASDTVKTLNTKNLFASKNANGVFVNGIKVTTADIDASNGVVHVIGSVLIPPTKSITQIVVDNPDFSTLKAVVILAGLDGLLAGPGKFTVFAPNNAAFVTSGVTDLSGFSPTAAADIIKQHAFGTNIFASDLAAGTTGATLNPLKRLDVALTPVTVKINGSTNPASAVTTANIVATNGVIHIINRVLLP